MTPAQQIAEQIVKAVCGPAATSSGEWVWRAAYHLASPPGGAAGQSLATFCEHFLHAYKNWNYNLESNGERWVLRQLAAFQPEVIFDVGSNVGDWLTAARSEIPNASFHAFEIIPETSAVLAKRMAAEPRIVVNPFGLADRTGLLTMHAFAASSQLASVTNYPHGPSHELSCQVRGGDEYLREHGVARIDFLKLDVEGAEPLVLRGFAEALDAQRIDVIQFEYGKVAILTHFLLKDFHDLLEQKGFRVGKIYPDHVDFRPYKLEDEDFLGPNYLAVLQQRTDIINALRKRSS